jgi:hypothetical protein
MATTAREGVSDIPINDGPAPEPPSSDEDAAFDNQVNRIVSARGRDRFETETGFTVFGDVDQVTIANGWKTETFEDNDAMHIRVYPPSPESTCSILIQFEQGFGTVLAVKPGFIGSVIVEDEKVISVNYTPSLGSKLYDEQYRHMADSIEEQRAFAATATRHGVLEFNKEGASDAASYLRSIKGKDPSLGIYACYAYQQAGQIEEIRSVARYMEDDGAVFFDVLLLARLGEPWPTFAPFCPMLRQGWAMLELHPPSLERLEKYRSHLQPSLWTGFTPEGADLIRNDLESGELQ